MKRLIVTCVLFVTLLCPTMTRAVDLSFLKSVYPITLPVPDENGIGVLARGCTAASIGEGEWLTAAHCVSHYTTHRYYIIGDEVTVVKIDKDKDLARLTTEVATAPALKIAEFGPDILDEIVVAGYPLGMKRVKATMGRVAGLEVLEIDGGFWPMTLISVTGAPGNSGSPVLNANHELVGVVHVGWMRDTFSPMMGATVFESLRTFLLK